MGQSPVRTGQALATKQTCVLRSNHPNEELENATALEGSSKGEDYAAVVALPINAVKWGPSVVVCLQYSKCSGVPTAV